jgi:hypothetical protein
MATKIVESAQANVFGQKIPKNKNAMCTITTDPIAPWFIAAEELGEFIGIRFGRVPPEGTEPEWMFLRHTDFDGIGGLAELLRRRGAHLPRLPQIKHPSPPSWLSLRRVLPKLLKPLRRVKWGALDGPVMTSTNTQSPPAVAWHIFEETETTQIRRVCRNRGFTVNSFLVKHLTKAVRPFLKDESVTVPWMIPINVRGKVLRERDTSNFTSYIGVKVASYETVHDIHRNIYAALGRGDHWGNWYMYIACGPLPARLKKFLFARELAISEWYLGAFSNLGDWDAEKEINLPDCEGGWLFAPPVLRCQLVGAGCVTFQNRLSLTIQAHPELTANPAVPQAWIQTWVKEIEMDVASVLAEPVAKPWRGASLHLSA